MKYVVSIALLSLAFALSMYGKVDVVLMGPVVEGNGVGQIGTQIAACLNSSNITTSLIPTNKPIRKELHVKDATVAMVTDSRLGFVMSEIPVFSKASIKLAYSMMESSKIPASWCGTFNKHFDAVVVPDANLIPIYQRCGVAIPIFVAALPMMFEPFLSAPLKSKAHHPFTFGVSANYGSGKNQLLLLEAFAQEFGNDPNIQLKMHGCWEWANYFGTIQKRLKELNLSNVYVNKQPLPQEAYLKFMQSLDCYVLISKGEGFSITPREAFALGLPCILSNVGAHRTICDTKLALGVSCKIPVVNPFFKEIFGEDCGVQYDCSLANVRAALRDAYKNYTSHLRLAQKRRDWSKNYLKENLKGIYQALFKPVKIVKGKRNLLTNNGYLITSSEQLYKKYSKIFG